jgi:murein L,D-transpeptidase YcbB/YkuD
MAQRLPKAFEIMRQRFGEASLKGMRDVCAVALAFAFAGSPARAVEADAGQPLNLLPERQSAPRIAAPAARPRERAAAIAARLRTEAEARNPARHPSRNAATGNPSRSNLAALAQNGKLPLFPDRAPPPPLEPAAPPAVEAPPEVQTAPDAPAAVEAAPAAAPAETPTAAAEAPAQPLAPLNAAVKAALEARARTDGEHPVAAARRRAHEAVAAFYAARDFAPLWSHDGAANQEVAPTLQRLERAAEDGLDQKGPPLRFAAGGAEDVVASADIALSDAVVAYGREASGSRIDPHAISPLIGARPEVADPSVILAIVSSAGANAGDALHNFNPPHQGYRALREKLADAQRGRAPVARGASIPPGPALKVGMRDPRVPLIRARLSLDGQPDAADKELVYDTRVASAVADFQKANGLPASGRLTERTIALLSGGGPRQLEAEIVANMERWRWMPRDMGDSRIEVNIPDYEVVVIENGAVAQRNRVVVGKTETPTPVFSNTMQFLIVNPAWNVPQSIIRKELLPKAGRHPGYLARLGYEASWHDGQLRVRQPPGERNALGRIKFMFPNDYSVYLHDTPSRALFEQDKRAFSHGCVRVDDPFRFAETVLGPGWSEERLKKLIGGKERYVNLARPLPIHIEYFTAGVDEFGRLRLREDIYGYSRKVRAALGLEG